MRRLKNGITSRLTVGPNCNMSEPSRKKDRFSGKNNGKRVRFVWRVSTSVSAKSVFIVSEAVTFDPIRCVTSRLGRNFASAAADGAGTPPPVVTLGRRSRPRPSAKSGSSVSSPARLVCLRRYCRVAEAQRCVSSSR
jgi:hypothetical protein